MTPRSLARLASVSLLVGLMSATAAAQTIDTSRCLPTDAACNPATASALATKIDPKFRFLKQVWQAHGPDSPAFGKAGAPDELADGQVGATLRFSKVLSAAAVADLEKHGVLFTRRRGKLVHVGPIYAAKVAWTAFDHLARHPLLIRADATWRPVVVAPLESTSEQVGASLAQKLPEVAVDGQGVTVADIDSGFDVLHPHFFRADGGYYAWQDANGNGRFDSGGDQLDHDGDGTADPLRVLDGSTVTRQAVSNRDSILQTKSDWVYLDVNDDEKRNAGPAHGFGESDPAYGEPIFVADDVDSDGVLDTNEKLVRLETSKFRKIMVDGQEYVRGTNLIDAAQSVAADKPGHGTGVFSIVAGGQKGFHDRVGLAPGVDLLGYAHGTSNSGNRGAFGKQLEAIADATDEGAALVLHEWTDVAWATPDGSTNVDAGMDQARRQGVVQVNPLGNLGLSDKHTIRQVDAGQTLEMGFYVGDEFQQGQQSHPYSSVYISFLWRNSDAANVTLVDPNGTRLELPLDEQTRGLGEAYAYGGFQTTNRGTRHAMVVIWREDSTQSIAEGDWTVELDGFTSSEEVTGRITDPYSSWSKGVYWLQPTADRGTMVFPSTADSAFGVAAYAGRHAQHSRGEDSEVGELRDYSGRGPRLDGMRGVDIAAPDDPFAALGITQEWLDAGYKRGWFSTFGGTSGAGPHVAAAIALLAEQHPSWTPDELEQALTQNAAQSSLTPDYGALPNTHWGHGKLDVYAALYGIARPRSDNRAPNAELSFDFDSQQVVLDASGSTDPENDTLEYRFDFDYDGQWDTDWAEQATATADLAMFGNAVTAHSRVSVRDTAGARDGALVKIARHGTPGPTDDTGTSAGTDGGQGADIGSDAATATLYYPQNDRGSGACLCDTGSSPSDGPGWLGVVVLAGLALVRSGRQPHQPC